jgi:hypothetical protein
VKRSIISTALAAVLALGIVGGGATSASAINSNGTCFGWGITVGTQVGGPFKGFQFLKNTTKRWLLVKVYEPGNIYMLNTAPGTVYYFESVNTRIYCS